MAQYSEGPWAFEQGKQENREMSKVFKKDDPGFLIGYVLCEFRNEIQRADDIANARLIAASPDLFAACEFVRKYAVMQAEKGSPLPSQLVNAVTSAVEKAGGAPLEVAVDDPEGVFNKPVKGPRVKVPTKPMKR